MNRLRRHVALVLVLATDVLGTVTGKSRPTATTHHKET